MRDGVELTKVGTLGLYPCKVSDSNDSMSEYFGPSYALVVVSEVVSDNFAQEKLSVMFGWGLRGGKKSMI